MQTLNETASDEASFCSSQKSSACENSSLTVSVDVVNWTQSPPNFGLVNYGSSDEDGEDSVPPSSDTDGAVFDFRLKIGGDLDCEQLPVDEMKP